MRSTDGVVNRVVAVCVVALVAGCAAGPQRAEDERGLRDGQVGFSEVEERAAADRVELGANESYQPPIPHVGNSLPAYPPALLAGALPPQTVCVQAGIAEDGSVSAAPAQGLDGCPDAAAVDAAFVAAAIEAVSAWRFEPAFRCIHPEGAHDHGHACSGDRTREVPQAVRLVYRFRFEQVDGRGHVGVAGG